MLYSKKNLESEEFLNQIKNRARDMMVYDEVHEASDLITSLVESFKKATDFKDKYPYLYAEYEKIIIRLKWLILPVMTDNEILDLFRNNFTEIYKIPDYDIWQKLKIILLGYIILGDRDDFKKSLRQALLNNNEKITSKKLSVNNQKKDPTVGNWILNYNSVLGAGLADDLKRIQYLTSNNDIKILDQAEKARVKTLLDLYEKLKLSSFTLEGLEEDIPVDEPGKEGIIRNGVFEPYGGENINALNGMFSSQPEVGESEAITNVEEREDLKELKTMLLSYPPGSFERKVVEEEIGRMESGIRNKGIR